MNLAQASLKRRFKAFICAYLPFYTISQVNHHKINQYCLKQKRQAKRCLSFNLRQLFIKWLSTIKNKNYKKKYFLEKTLALF